jgi:hypothetical protein
MDCFQNGGWTPGLCIKIQDDAHYILYWNYSIEPYKENAKKNQSHLTSNSCHNTYKLEEGGVAMYLELTPMHVILKSEATANRPTMSQEHKPIQQTLNARVPLHTLLKALPPSSTDPSLGQGSRP